MIGCGYISNVIYIGHVRTYKDGHKEWMNDRREVTKEAVASVIDHIRTKEKQENKVYTIPIDGETYELRLVKVEEARE